MGLNHTRRTYAITDGPNRELLFDALKHAYDKDVMIPVTFQIEHDQKPSRTSNEDIKILDIKISGIDHEDGSGISFIIKGFLHICIYPLVPTCDNYSSEQSMCQFTALYNTQTKTGRMNLLIL